MKFQLIGALALVALTGCSKNIDTTDAVKQGVLRDIPKDVNVGNMDVNVVSVSFRGQEADAVVSFAPRGGTPMMSMNYTMERKANEWHIKKRATGDIQKHASQAPGGLGAGSSMGGSAPPLTGNETQLPPGHPPMGGAGSQTPAGEGAQLPPGHPSVGRTNPDSTKK
ncbi:MAG: hypothetical protein QOJ99_3812 [Bryobacterales bacterium]|nr:hypothetical protein [Bryobacterales bacterium]